MKHVYVRKRRLSKGVILLTTMLLIIFLLTIAALFASDINFDFNNKPESKYKRVRNVKLINDYKILQSHWFCN